LKTTTSEKPNKAMHTELAAVPDSFHNVTRANRVIAAVIWPSRMHNFNHPKVKPFTREVGTALALDVEFVDFVLATKRPECFRNWVEDVDRGWTCYIPDEIDAAYALWCTNSDQTLILLNGIKQTFAKGWHDSWNIEIISETTQGLLTSVMSPLAESELPENELHQAAAFCGYRFLDDLLTFIDKHGADYMGWSEAMAGFIASIDARSR